MATLTVRIDDDVHALMRLAAAATGKSVHAWMLDAHQAQILRQAHGDAAGPVAAALNKRMRRQDAK